MDKLIIKSKLDDKYFSNYKYLFNYSVIKFSLINTILLFNFIFLDNNKLCNYSFNKFNYHKYYSNIFSSKTNFLSSKNNKFNTNYKNYIIDKFINNDNISLIILNSALLIKNYSILNKKINVDIIILFNEDLPNNIKNIKNPNINKEIFNNYYSSILYNKYKNFLKKLKDNENTDTIPHTKYKSIFASYDYNNCLSLSASYKMALQIPHLISTIAISLKLLEKNGNLLLFWSIVNINIPVIKKILAILVYGFKTVLIIDNDINQNLLIGVPEYYIKCEGYKANISNEIINKLLDIAIETLDYLYVSCDVLDYYEDYSKKNPNHSLFYNKVEDETQYNQNNHKHRNIKKTKKYSSFSRTKSSSKTSKSSIKNSSKSSKSLTKKSSSKSSKLITPIYYIEDINIPELDIIMKNSNLQFKVSLLMNKLEGIFVGYFEMVNNLIVNAIAYDRNGDMYVKPQAIIQKDITNLTKLINMFEYNKLPYNKHALKVLLNKQDEILDHFYSLDNPINHKLIKYDDRVSKILNKNALSYLSSNKTYKNTQAKDLYNLDILNIYYNRIKLARQVKNKLIEDIDINKYKANIPKSVEYAAYDFSPGLCQYLNNKFNDLPIKIGNPFVNLWEILSIFNLMPNTLESFKAVYLGESTGQMIMCGKYWIETKCPKIKNKKYEWMANSINPYNTTIKTQQNKLDTLDKINKIKTVQDEYNLIKENYDKWLWGADNTGDLTNINNIKSIRMGILNSSNSNSKKKVDLIVSDGSVESKFNTLHTQKTELAQVLGVIACSSLGGDCCVKHFIPSNNKDDISVSVSIPSDNTIEVSGFFISYLYLYYILFDSVSLYKPNSSNSDNGEFYVIGKGFKGITEQQLENLLSILEYFIFNESILDQDKIPLTFIKQINNFLEEMSNTNILSIEKQNLLLTCYKNLDEDEDQHKYKQTNKILKCNNFFNKNKLDTMIIPKYREWIKVFNFQ